MAQLETHEGKENANGESFIRQWTIQNKLSKFTDVFIDMELTIDELLFLAVRPKEIEEFCVEHDIKSIHKKRFEDALIKLSSKHSSKQDTNMPQQQIIVATLSVEEEQIVNKLNEQHKKNKNRSEKIDNLMKENENKQKLCANNINLTFSELQKALNNRKNILLKDLERISNEKKNKLLSTKQRIEEFDNKIKSFQTTCNKLLLNWKMDKTERKQNIINDGQNILNDKSLSVQINENINIEFKYDKKKTNEFVAAFGAVDGLDVPDCPEISISEIYDDKIQITEMVAGKVQLLQVEIAQFEGNYENDMKLEWNSNEFEIKQENEMYDVKGLKYECDYVLRAKCKNEKGWSQYGAVQTFKTKKRRAQKISQFVLYNKTHFVVSNNGKTLKGNSGNCHSSTVYMGSGYNSGVHTCSVKLLGNVGCFRAIGISSGPRRTETKDGKNYFFKKYGGYSYHFDGLYTQPNWNKNEVIQVTLDCENWKVSFIKEGHQLKQENIERNQTYYFALDSCGDPKYGHYEIV